MEGKGGDLRVGDLMTIDPVVISALDLLRLLLGTDVWRQPSD
jgi:hypothetical protein